MVELVICRACGTECDDYRSLFKQGILLGEITTLATILNYCSDINVMEDDNFPNSMCVECIKCLCKLYSFKKMVMKTNAAFINGTFGNKNVELSDETLEHPITEPIQYIAEEEVESVELEGLATAAQIKSALDKMEYIALGVLPETNEIDNDEEASELQNEEHLELDDELTSAAGSTVTEAAVAAAAAAVAMAEEAAAAAVAAVAASKQEHAHDDAADETEIEYITDDANNPTDDVIHMKNNTTTNTFESFEITLLNQRNEKPDIMTESEADIELEVGADTETVAIEPIVGKKVSIRKTPTKYRQITFLDAECESDNKMKRNYISRSKKPFKTPNSELRCKICTKQLSNMHSFRYHMQLHSDEKPYLCSLCGDSFKTRNSYEGHIILHDPNNPNTCEICGKSYRQPSSLRTHMLTHTGEKPFQCDICGKGMTQKSGYKKHMLVHTGEKPHTCDVCFRDFRYSSNLFAHKRCHSGEKPFACADCEKCFLSQEQLKRHSLVHNKDKPFSCEQCDKTFKRRSSLTAHKLTHMAPNIMQHQYIVKKFNKTNLVELY